MREQPLSVLRKLQQASKSQHRLVISAISYAEMQYGAASKKASPKHQKLVQRIDTVLPWDRQAVDASTNVKKQLEALGTVIGSNDTAIAGHTIATACVLVSNNIREFSRVPGLALED